MKRGTINQEEIEELLFCEFIFIFFGEFLKHVGKPVWMNVVEIVEELALFEELDDFIEIDIRLFFSLKILIELIHHFPLIYSKILEFFATFCFLEFLLLLENIMIILCHLLMIIKWWLNIGSPLLHNLLIPYFLLIIPYDLFRLHFMLFLRFFNPFLSFRFLWFRAIPQTILYTAFFIVDNRSLFLCFLNFLMEIVSCLFD